MNIDKKWLDTHEWMLRSSNNGISYDGYKWPSKNRWAKAPDWSELPKCGGGFHGNAPEAHGFGFLYSRIELAETRGPRVPIDGNKIKTLEARLVAFNEEIPHEAFARCGLTAKTVRRGTITPKRGNLYFVTGRVKVVGMSCGYIVVCRGGTVNATGQTGGECHACGGTVNATDQTGGSCYAYSGTVNATGQAGGECHACGGTVKVDKKTK